MNRSFRAMLVAAIWTLGFLSAPIFGEAGAISFSTALPIAQGQGVLRLQAIGARAGGDVAGSNRDLRKKALGMVLAYGITSKLTFFASLPVVNLNLDVESPGGRMNRHASGLGDLRLLARYTIFQRDAPGKTLRLAPFLGIEAPTGAHDRSDDLGLLPPPAQPGSGSWDVMGGFALTRQTLRSEFDGSVSYTIAGSGDWFVLGDEASFALSYQRRIAPRELGPGVPAFLYAVIESTLVWRGRTSISDLEQSVGGGTTWFVSPGLQHVTRSLVIEGVVQIPVTQNVGPGVPDVDWIIRVGVRIAL